VTGLIGDEADEVRGGAAEPAEDPPDPGKSDPGAVGQPGEPPGPQTRTEVGGDLARAESSPVFLVFQSPVDGSRVEGWAACIVARQGAPRLAREPGDETLGSTAEPAQCLQYNRVPDRT